MVIVGARKPEFFTDARAALRGGRRDDGLLPPGIGALQRGRRLLRRARARWWSSTSGSSGDEILYVGDHMFGDVHVTKSVLRWRTALILRELEDEIARRSTRSRRARRCWRR